MYFERHKAPSGELPVELSRELSRELLAKLAPAE
jgi:hypothetical protein